MRNIELTKENLILFLNNLKQEDKEELDEFLKNNTIDDFINICFKNKNTTCFLADEFSFPLILGGVCKNKNKGLVWLLCSNKHFKHKKEIYKYIKNKINEYKKEYDFLFNYIYKSNFKALNWLLKLGFKTKEENNKDFKLFYFKKEK